MKIESQIEQELANAGYEFVRRGKHSIYKNSQLQHVITVPTTTHDNNALHIVRGLIRRGQRQAMNRQLSIDNFLDRMPGPAYNCLDFVREVWKYLTGEDVTDKLTGLIGDFDKRKANLSGVKAFKRLQQPVDPCFVVMQRFKYVPHCGIYLDGRILHLKDNGVEFQPLIVAQSYFQIVRYYASNFN